MSGAPEAPDAARALDAPQPPDPREARPPRRAARAPHLIRPLEPRDRQAVRDICCATAFRNAGSDLLFEDREVHADYWTSYFTDHRPEDCWVAEIEGEVVAYFLGCADHAHFLRVMGRRIVPSCLARALWRSATGRYRKPETRRYLWHMIRRGAAEAPRIPYLQFPAHYHCNTLRKGYGRHLYTTMLLMFLDRLEARGVDRFHGLITEPREGGIWHRFNAALPGHVLAYDERPTTLFRDVLGDPTPYVNRGWGTTVEGGRRWAGMLRDDYRL